MRAFFRRFSLSHGLALLWLIAYTGGYVLIRSQCETFVGHTVIVPAYVSRGGEQTLIYRAYRPLFLAERHIFHRQFTWSPWAAPTL